MNTHHPQRRTYPETTLALAYFAHATVVNHTEIGYQYTQSFTSSPSKTRLGEHAMAATGDDGAVPEKESASSPRTGGSEKTVTVAETEKKKQLVSFFCMSQTSALLFCARNQATDL